MIKNYIFGLFFLGLTLYLGFELYERTVGSESPEGSDRAELGSDRAELGSDFSESGLSFPDEISIVRSDGTELDIRLTARNSTQIQFERMSDGREFVFAIDQLDKDTQQLVQKYPNSGFDDTSRSSREEPLSLESAYVSELRVAIARIDEKLEELEAEFSKTESRVEQRTLKNNAKKLLQERAELEGKIAEREGV